jgi:hypothetical protein
MPQMNRQQLAEHVGKLISNDRNATYGDPHLQFLTQQKILAACMEHRRGQPLTPTTYHALQMITTKLSRICCGTNLQDHWLDIAGYALIAAEHAERPLDAQP